jgi:hypothetical protein
VDSRATPPRIVYRYLSGRPLGGRQDGGYLRAGAGGSTWARWPGWRRQAVRLGVPGALLGSWAAYSTEPVLTEAGGTALATVTAVRVVRAGRRAWRSRRFRAAYIRPTLAALAPALGDAPVRLHVDPGLGTLMPRLARPMSPAETAVRTWYGQRVELAAAVPYLTAEQRQYVSAVIGAKIPAGELVEQWDQIGPRVRATWTVRRRPPARVGYADLTARLDQLAEWEFFLGLGVGGKPVVVSLRDDSPHIACSAGSGAGKSVLAQLVGVQVLARGGQVVILDLKGSHRWALGLPGVDYCTSPEQMHRALVRLAALADERNTMALHEPEDWDPGHRVLVIAEELNATFARLRDYWVEVREKSDPKTSPAVRAFRNIMYMGRSAKVNMLAIAQMLTAQTTGGPESRENFGVRCLARYTRNAWQMLVPEAAMPRASRTLGRWQIVVGGVATECQVCYLTPAEARLLVHKMSPGTRTPLIASDQQMSPGHRPVGDKIPDPLAELVTLRAATERGVVPWQAEAAKKRLQRARKAGSAAAPAPAGKDGLADAYRVGDLIAWAEAELGLARREDPR